MANNNGPKQKSVLLWMIAPLSVFVTLLFVSVNNNTLPPRVKLDGARPAIEDLAKPTAPAEAATLPAEATPADSGASMPMN